jgi:adenine/guanine phosphoribosyltransferase-like PRPP-binding protein
VTPLFADYAGFMALVDDFTTQLGGLACDLVAGIDALGFILGTALAMRLGTGFLAMRKEGKLPVAADAQSFVGYTGLTQHRASTRRKPLGIQPWRCGTRGLSRQAVAVSVRPLRFLCIP